MTDDATIFAPSTPRGRGAVAVIRVSGPESQRCAADLCGGPIPFDRRMRLRRLVDAEGETIDHALVVGFPRGRSFSGDAMLELHCHGGPAVVDALLSALGETPGLRPATPGEFTRRAVENGRLDLVEAEALADLVAAETEGQRELALLGLSGAFSARLAEWRARLTEGLALLEADIDFSDEDIGDGHIQSARAALAEVRDAFRAECCVGDGARAVRDGFTVAVIGPPNVGKSTLVNALARREIAITSDIPGTTRDVLEARLVIGGQTVILLDTAGLRLSAHPIEKLGVERAETRAAEADLRVFVSDSERSADLSLWKEGDLHVRSKADVFPEGDVSAVSGVGLSALATAIGERAAAAAAQRGLAFRERHLAALREGAALLTAALAAREVEIAAEEVRGALRQLDGLLGRIDVEDVLGEIFASFCIGK